MLRLFSSIRQSLLAENKTVRYLQYALGEFLLIVAGILVALQIQTWNEGRKLEQERQELIEDLKMDFQANLKQAREVVVQSENDIHFMKTFMESVVGDDQQISEEEVVSFHKVFMARLRYRPLLGNYHSADSDGSISLLNDPSLNELFLEFIEHNNYFQMLVQISIQDYFSGEIQALRRSLGSLQNHTPNIEIPNATEFKQSVTEFIEWMNQKEVYASYESRLIMKTTRNDRLLLIIDLTEQILTALESLE